MSDPMSSLEEAHGQRSVRALALNTYVGARAEADNWRDAFWATVAALTAVLKSAQEPEE